MFPVQTFNLSSFKQKLMALDILVCKPSCCNIESSFLKPIETELEALQFAENMVVNEEVSLQAACDWLEYKTDRRMSAPGLKKHIDK